MTDRRIPYDLVAAYGQILLGVISLLIATVYKESQNRVMSSDWHQAFILRRRLYFAVPCFFIASLVVLIAVVLQSVQSTMSLLNGTGVSTLLVATITVFFVSGNEQCFMRDVFDLRVNQIDAARITALTNEREPDGLSPWYMKMMSLWSGFIGCKKLQQLRKEWALSRAMVGFSAVRSFLPQLEPFHLTVEDIIESAKVPPLQLKTTDYQFVAVMVRFSPWRMVCACETSYQEFYATLRLLQNRYQEHGGAPKVKNDPGVIVCYSNLLALAEKGDRSVVRDQYRSELTAFRDRHGLEKGNDAGVIIQWIYNSLELGEELRTWDLTFKMDVQDMLAVCPLSSAYREILVEISKVNDETQWNALYHKMSSKDYLKVTFILYALKSHYHMRGVRDVTMMRKWFMANCKKYVTSLINEDEKLSTGLRAMLCTDSARNLADIAVLTFLRVGRGWEESWTLSNSSDSA